MVVAAEGERILLVGAHIKMLGRLERIADERLNICVMVLASFKIMGGKYFK